MKSSKEYGKDHDHSYIHSELVNADIKVRGLKGRLEDQAVRIAILTKQISDLGILLKSHFHSDKPKEAVSYSEVP